MSQLIPAFPVFQGEERLNGPVPLSIQIYPDEGHYLHSKSTRQHQSQSLVNFFEECFRLPDKAFEERLEEETEEEG